MSEPEKGAVGSACAADTECESGTCRDEVCCASECSGACEACAAALTGATNGTCASVTSGMDPHDDCEAESPESCGNDGTCNGGGACRKYGQNQVCRDAACSESDYRPASTCDGSGTCAALPAVACGQYPCSVEGCETPCSTDADCPSEAYCATDVCHNKETAGSACSGDSACRSGACVDGVCCESACNLACQACSNAATGQADGICAARTTSATKPCTSGASTTCVNLTNNVNNCGSCGNVCGGSSLPGTAPVCSSSTCSVACPAGTLGDGTNVCIPVNTIAAGTGFACGLLTDGHVKCWGDPALGLSPAGLDNVLFTSITAAPNFMCGIRDNGLAYCWGTNAPLSVKGGVFYSLAAGDMHVCGIKANRTLDCWTTDNGDGTDAPPAGTYRAVGSGSQFSCAIVQGGNLNGRGTCWGTQVDGGVFTFPSTSNTQTYTQMHGAGIGFWTLLPDGTTRTFGKTLFSAPSGTVFKTVADGPSQNRCGILPDSSLLCWGFPNDAATIAPSGTFKAVTMGSGFGCGVKTAGSVACWGTNDMGQAPASVSGPFQGYW